MEEERLNIKKELERLENMIKERETSRFRATRTLITDVFESVNSEKKIPLASIKGFIFSWIFPSAVMVGGSIITSLLIIFQSYLLVVQNGYVDRQNRLMAFEQTSSFREKLSQGGDEQIIGSKIYSKVNQSVVEQLILFGTEEPDVVGPALLPLLHDDNSIVAAGALYSLLQLDAKKIGIRLNLHRSELGGAYLRYIILESRDLSYSNFSSTNLTNSYLNNSVCDDCIFNNADLSATEINNTSFNFADFEQCNLQDVIGYDNIRSMAGANLRDVMNPPKDFKERCFMLGAVDMSNEHWNRFKKDLSAVIGDRDVATNEIFKKYLRERGGPDYVSWKTWLNTNVKL